MEYNLIAINSTTNLDDNGYDYYQYFLADASGGSFTITLPTNVWDGLSYIINRTDSNILTTITINANTGTVNGGASIIVTGKTYVDLIYFNGDWKASRVGYA
jgi:hypothetical protein